MTADLISGVDYWFLISNTRSTAMGHIRATHKSPNHGAAFRQYHIRATHKPPNHGAAFRQYHIRATPNHNTAFRQYHIRVTPNHGAAFRRCRVSATQITKSRRSLQTVSRHGDTNHQITAQPSDSVTSRRHKSPNHGAAFRQCHVTATQITKSWRRMYVTQ